MLERKIILTADGSSSIYIPEWEEHYHSYHGAINESYHVFIKNGLDTFQQEEIHVLEIGLGTGLNCFITFLEAQKRNLKINYTGIEAYPIDEKEFTQLNYTKLLKAENDKAVFEKIHLCDWNKNSKLSDNFNLIKKQEKFQDLNFKNIFNLIYFDAFGPRVQPELWTETIFKKMYNALKINGVLVTYSAKGSVRRTLQKVGFYVERLEGPPGKREMLRAIKKPIK